MADRETRLHVGGDVLGQVVVGDHNITIWAEQSVVTVVAEGERPEPRRRDGVRLLPRRMAAAPIGREREIDALRRAVAANRLVQVYGPPGSGRSTLIRHACDEVGAGAVVFLPAAGEDVGDLLQAVFEACYDSGGYRPGSVELRRLMADVDVHLFIDDLDVEPDERDRLLDGVPAAAVVFTSVERSVWADGETLALEGLDTGGALALLARVLGRPLRADEYDAGVALWRATGGSPLLLLRAAAVAGRAPDSVLPRPAELAEMVPLLVAGLSDAAGDAVSLLSLAGSAVIPSSLLGTLVGEPDAVGELVGCGLVIGSGDGYRLAPGIASGNGDSSGLERMAGGLRDWVRSAGPREVADHAALIATVVDATVAAGRPDLGALLARSAAPVVACSLRLGAWERILHRGGIAAERAGDRPVLAYLTHEDGIRSLVTGKRAAAVAAAGAAAALWHELGDATQVAAAHHVQALAGHGVVHAATSGAAPTAVTHHVAGAGHAALTKTGLGLTGKLVIAGTAAVTIAGGGYVAAATLVHPHHVAAAPAVRSSLPPQLTGVQLASALLPSPAGHGFVVSGRTSSGPTVTTAAAARDLTAMTCTNPLTSQKPLFDERFDTTGFTPGFGESAFASEVQTSGDNKGVMRPTDDDLFFDQAIYQFPTAAKAVAFFAGVRQVMAACNNDATNRHIGAAVDAKPVNGHRAIIAEHVVLLTPTPSRSVNFGTRMVPFLVLNGVDVYALASGQGRDVVGGGDDSGEIATQFPSFVGELASNVAALNSHRPSVRPLAATGSPSNGPSPDATPATGPAGVVQSYIAAINAHDYRRAWALGGRNIGESYSSFAAGFAGTDHDVLTVQSVNGDTVTADLAATGTDGTVSDYHGVYTVNGGTITHFRVDQTG